MKKIVIKKLSAFSAEEKKKYLIFPLIVAVVLCGLIYSFNTAENETTSSVEKEGASNENLTMPVPNKKELSVDKSEISSELERDNQKKLNARKKDFYSVYNEKGDEPLQENQENLDTTDKATYKNNNQELINKVKEQLNKIEAEKNKPVTPSNNSNQIVRKSPTVSVTKQVKSKEQIHKEWKQRIKEENDAFYNSPSASYQSKKSSNTSSNLQTDKEIFAVVYRDQTIINNGRVSLRLAQDAIINGISYKRNTLFFGFSRFAQNRIHIQIDKINNRSVALNAYDAQDSNEGIYTEVNFQNLVEEAIKDNVESDVDASSVPLGNTLKSVLNKKRKADKVLLFNEYKLILKAK